MGIGFWPVAVVPVGRVACATTLWRAKGRLHVTVVVKSRFEVVNGDVMKQILPEPVRPQHGEVAPYLGQADVVITGAHAFAVPPRRVTALAVRLALFREWAVIDKSLLVFPCDSDGKRTEAMVDKLPLQGEADKSKGIVVNPSDPTQRGSFGPVDLDDAARAKLLGDVVPPRLEGDVVELPNMFPWSYYQVAPPDQRTTFLQGDEWVVLDGMHATNARTQSRLPGARVHVRVYPPGFSHGQSYMVQMKTDQLSIDADRGHVSLLWRGSFPVADEASARQLTLVAGVQLPGKSLAWPSMAQLMRSPILRAHGLVTPANPNIKEDSASMAATSQVSQEDLLRQAEVLAAARAAEAELDPLTSMPLDDDDIIEVIEDEAPISLRVADVAELTISDDGVLVLEPKEESMILEPDPHDDDELLATVELSAQEGDAMRAALGLAPVGLAPPHEDDVLRPDKAVVVGSAAEGPVAASVDEPPELEDISIDMLELTFSDALEAHGFDDLEDVSRQTPDD